MLGLLSSEQMQDNAQLRSLHATISEVLASSAPTISKPPESPVVDAHERWKACRTAVATADKRLHKALGASETLARRKEKAIAALTEIEQAIEKNVAELAEVKAQHSEAHQALKDCPCPDGLPPAPATAKPSAKKNDANPWEVVDAFVSAFSAAKATVEAEDVDKPMETDTTEQVEAAIEKVRSNAAKSAKRLSELQTQLDAKRATQEDEPAAEN